MLRLVVTLWFALTTLLGPGWCCCLLRLPAALAASDRAQKTAPVEETPCACCREAETVLSPVAGTAPAPCPCKVAAQVEEPTTPPPPRESGPADPTQGESLQVLVGDELCRTAGPVAVDRPPVLPFPSTEDLLFVFHILRC